MSEPAAAAELERLWREIAARSLRGHDPADLAVRTEDGIAILPVHFRHQAPWREGVPGAGALLRGSRAAGTLPQGWRVLQAVREPQPTEAAAVVAEELQRGGDGVWLWVDHAPAGRPPTGVVWRTAADVAATLGRPATFAGMLMITAGWRTAEVAARLLAWRGDSRTPQLRFGADPLAAALAGEPVDVAADYDRIKGLLARLEAAGGEDRVLVADGTVAFEAGASPAEMLALTLATVAEHLRQLANRGLSPAAVLARMDLRLAVDAEVFEAAAALRAMRRLWASLTTHVGCAQVRPWIHAVAAARMYTRYDPWTNMLRATAATLAAAIGGADALTIWPFDHALGLPEAFGRRIARNTQLIARLEAHLPAVIDPAGGSPYIKRLAHGLAERAWEFFQEIERRGGLLQALQEGWPQARIRTTAEARMARIRRRQLVLVGVSDFIDLDEPRPTPRRPEAEAPKADRTEGPHLPLPRDFAALAEALTAEQAFRPDTPRPAIEPLAPQPLAAPFERLRDLAAARSARGETLPRALILGLGAPRDHVGPMGFARHLLAAGGFPAEEMAPVAGPEEAARQLAEGGFAFAVLAGSEERLRHQGASIATALRQAGARRVFATLADPGPGIDGGLYRGLDVVAWLEDLWSLFGERVS